ncbi:carbamoyltransferase [Burkholderia stagnalis]|uniref:carbamoyltransferase family protein n=1 Tax=Burkholderia stagnalis TaxID=1503054 RepID=UPI0007557B08|nr:carbamoyltransferase C-terminal domain-containing protein [Burkholderia stagnalis]KVC59044.1 carbamoyltransferase [Burkholderia stagnalis]KVN21892.1 carbamoyltransferase [Burkholderia stagnalis]KWI65372.1 carbamoyltransferase [Burkholderia stagnalis]KWK63066.1 carbamoyltransferase [Burkholderia stagnalis]KWN24967.1 carbamoyltransferase [Burkholderia stagnalis]
MPRPGTPEPLYTLGINAAFHDSAACLVRDGEVLAAAEEERFTHVKHAKRPVPFSTWELPFNAIDCCLAQAGIALADVHHVAYSYDPWIELGHDAAEPALTLPLSPSAHARPAGGAAGSPWHPLFLSSIVNAPRQLAGGAPHHLQRRLRGVAPDGPYRWHFVEHHLAHEASAFLAAPFERCAVLTMDGRGERATTSYGAFDGRRYRRLGQVDLPHSLGLLYERVTRYLGFLHSSDEYKVMALASYGTPVFADAMQGLVRYRGDGQYELVDGDLAAMFGPPRERGGPITPHHCDVAHALQRVLEDTVLQAADWLAGATGERHLAMAGGVALNCVMNAKLRDQGRFDDVWVQPAAGDAGTALGAALWTDFRMRGARGDWRMDNAYLGPAFDDDAIEAFLQDAQVPYRRMPDVAAQTAALLAENQVVGWFQGRMEFGPRALGARSILASPIDARMQQRLNRIKDREDFRPVAPVVLEEKASRWFAGGKQARLRAPFMLFVYDIVPGRDTEIPAVCHIDGTARVQTVDAAQHPLLYALLTEFEALTGVPVLVNTSFNTRGEPIVCTPRDAVECFWTSPLDALVIGSFLLEKRR